jgi:threonine dehydrogenase-like Zn-dependent dehydrogenase
VKSGVLKPSNVVTHRIPLDEIAEGYHLMSNKLDGVIKPLVVPAAA